MPTLNDDDHEFIQLFDEFTWKDSAFRHGLTLFLEILMDVLSTTLKHSWSIHPCDRVLMKANRRPSARIYFWGAIQQARSHEI